MPCKTTNEDTLHLPYLIFIRYYHARLVMNRHLYGPTHCVSINKFNKRARTVEDAFRVTITVSHHSCIVDDKLLVSSTMLMSHPRGDAASFRRSVDERPRPVCAHIGMRKPYSPGLAPAQLPELEASPSRRLPTLRRSMRLMSVLPDGLPHRHSVAGREEGLSYQAGNISPTGRLSLAV
jgi:hypothetical protein